MTDVLPHISSRHNPVVARMRALARGDVPDALLVDGVHLVEAALAARLPLVQAVVARDALDGAECGRLVARLRDAGVPTSTAAPAVMAAVSPVRTASPIVVEAGRPASEPGRLYAPAPACVLVAVDVQDPGNVGAIARSADAGGATGLVTTAGCADPFGWKALRGSMGSALRLPIVSRADARAAIADARECGCRVIAAVPADGRDLYRIALDGPVAIVLGAEGAGLDRAIVEAADERLQIPMAPGVESLNVATAAALVVYEARRQRQRAV